MAYQGNVPAEAYTTTVKDTFNGNGSTTAFTLSLPTVTNDIRVVVENVVQEPTAAYSVSGTTLTFTAAPPSGTGNVYVVHLGPAVQTVQPPSTISNATVFESSVTVQGAFTSLGIDDNATSTAMTIDSSGRVMVGKTATGLGNAGAELDPSGQLKGTAANVVVQYLNRTGSDGTIAEFRKDNTTVGSIGVESGDNITFGATSGGGSGLFMFGSGGTSPFILPMKEGALSDNTVTLGDDARRFKDLYLSGGVYLGGTGAANKLDDYEEGTWTPTLPNGGTVTPNGGYYVKIGASVTLTMQADFAPTNNGSTFKIGGIPFVNKTGASTYSVGSVGYSGALDTSNWHAPLIENNGANHMYFQRNDGTTAPIYNSAFSGGTYNLILAVTYFTDS